MAKKALIVNPYWDTLGGGERYVATFIRYLLAKGWSVDTLSPYDELVEKIENRFGLDISGVNLNPCCKPSSYDLAFFVSDGSLPVSFAGKTIIHLQFPFSGIGGKKPLNLVKSRFYTFVVNSLFTKSFIDREFLVDSEVVYPPVDVDSFNPGKKQKTILYVGRFSNLTQSKGQTTLIDAFKGIVDRMPGWKLVLAGGTSVGTDKTDLARLRQMAEKGIELVTDPDFDTLKKLYSSSSIFWSASGFGINEQENPTRVEHFGITVVEAMAGGCVPIITGLGGHKEIVEDGKTGYLWNSIGELQELTLNLAKKSAKIKTMSEEAVRRSKMFSVIQFEKRFDQILNP